MSVTDISHLLNLKCGTRASSLVCSLYPLNCEPHAEHAIVAEQAGNAAPMHVVSRWYFLQCCLRLADTASVLTPHRAWR
jgi:hypothetical protein